MLETDHMFFTRLLEPLENVTCFDLELYVFGMCDHCECLRPKPALGRRNFAYQDQVLRVCQVGDDDIDLCAPLGV